MLNSKTKLKILFVGLILLTLPLITKAVSLGQTANFFIEPSYDLNKREQISATLQKVGSNLYFYIDDNWWSSLDYQKKEEAKQALSSLDYEFYYKIYPILTSSFGSEWKPGIDKDEKITVLLHPMIEDAGGYFKSGDEYYRLQSPKSNEREMVYLNANYVSSPLFKGFLAHEFMHLISFNQKEETYGVQEEIWLNEARAEYASTFLGYDDVYEGSNLQKRVRIFLEKPYDSLTEWQNEKYDYGVINLFAWYLVDYYGVKILTDSLHSEKVGIFSLNYALQKNGFGDDFSQIFTNWTIATWVNNCDLGEKYCYLNPNLKNFRITPEMNFLPLLSESALSTTNALKNWAAKWQKFIGGKGTLTLEFDGDDKVNFKVPYLICDYSEKCSINFLTLDKEQKGKITVSEFNTKYPSLIIIPSIQAKISGSDGEEPFYLFSWTATVIEKTEEEKEAELIKTLLAQIEGLKKEIARLQQLLSGTGGSCQSFSLNLYYGITNSPAVSCLQEFLKNKGGTIYPEGMVSGNYFSLTTLAVKRYQALKSISQTGYFGPLTRAAANADLGL